MASRRRFGTCAALLLGAGLPLVGCEVSERGEAPGNGALSSSGSEAKSEALARLDGQPVTVAEARALLRGRDASDPARRRAALEGVITRRLAAAEARRRGLAGELTVGTEAMERGNRARQEALLRAALYERVRDDLKFSEAELRAHYEKTRSRFLERQLRLRRQSFPDRAAAEAAHAALGATGGLDPEPGEEIGPAPLRELPASVLPEASRLERPGDRVVVARHGFAALVELVEVLPAEVQPFEAVRHRVEQSLRTLRGQEAMAALLDELRADAHVEIDEAALADGALWAEGAEGQDAIPEPTVESQPGKNEARVGESRSAR